MLRNKKTGCFLTVKYQSSLSDMEQIETSSVFLSSNEHDYNKYWIFENTDKIKGGKIKWKHSVFIRNATLSGYLTDDLKLSDVPLHEFNLRQASICQGKAISMVSEIILKVGHTRISCHEVDPRRDILGKMVPIKG